MAKLSDEELLNKLDVGGQYSANLTWAKVRGEILDRMPERMGKVDVPPHLAFEFGYKQCEKGNNIQMATDNFNKALNGGK